MRKDKIFLYLYKINCVKITLSIKVIHKLVIILYLKLIISIFAKYFK